jgi:biotin carboxylase
MIGKLIVHQADAEETIATMKRRCGSFGSSD